MQSHKFILGSVCRFALIYGLLLLPWPRWDQIYSSYFQHLGRIVFSSDESTRIVLFQPVTIDHGFSHLDTRLTLANRETSNRAEGGPAVNVDLNSRSLGWIPTALTTALILATPIPWPRKIKALVCGLFLVQLFIVFSLGAWIWDNSSTVGLVSPSPLWQRCLSEIDYTLVSQLGASFSIPLLIWIIASLPFEWTKQKQAAAKSGI